MSTSQEDYCLRCFRKGHTYHLCNYLEDRFGNKLKGKGIEVLEVLNNKYYVNSYTLEKCEKCRERKHLNPVCGKSIFIYQEDMD